MIKKYKFEDLFRNGYNLFPDINHKEYYEKEFIPVKELISEISAFRDIAWLGMTGTVNGKEDKNLNDYNQKVVDFICDYLIKEINGSQKTSSQNNSQRKKDEELLSAKHLGTRSKTEEENTSESIMSVDADNHADIKLNDDKDSFHEQ